MGRICNDLIMKTSPNGNYYVQFRIAVDRRFQKKGEEKLTDFFNVCCWRSTAEFVTKYFSKGRLILLEGEMQTRPYTDKKGNDAIFYEVVADNVYFTGEKASSSTSEAPVPVDDLPPQENQEKTSSPPAEEASPKADDDYPF